MAGRILTGIQMRRESRSYIDALHAVMTYQGRVDYPKSMLAGMTANGFRMTVNRRLSAESATAYNWMAEHFVGLDFIGFTSGQKAGFAFDATFPLYQASAIRAITASIDKGTAPIIWRDGFMAVTGYDDEQEVLYYLDGADGLPQTLPYSQFGRNQSPYWYYQVIEDHVGLDEMEIYRESLIQAVYKWETHDLLLPESDYACGKQAYPAMIEAFQTGQFAGDEAGQVILDYAAAKSDIGQYTAALLRYWPETAAAAGHYAETAALWEQMSAFVDTMSEKLAVHSAAIEALIRLLQRAMHAEGQAISAIRVLMRERIANRYHEIGLR